MHDKIKTGRKILRGGGKTVLILFTGIVTGFAALCLVHLLPVERMHQNVQNSRDTIGAYAQVVSGYISTTVDNFTDSIILNQAICPVEAPVLEKAVFNYQVNYWRKYEQPENLYRFLNGEKGFRYQGYTHYWGGYQVILKPLLMIFNYSDILVINMILQTLLGALIILGLYKTGKRYVILPFLTSVLSMMPITAAICLQLCDIYYIALTGAALIVWKREKIKDEGMYLLFLVLGMATSYFDFLTYPFVSLGVPLVIFLAYLNQYSPAKRFFYTVLCSGQWCVGYLGMWAGKWILGSILIPEGGALKVAIDSIRYRGSNLSSDNVRLTVLNVVLKNMYVYLRWPVMLLIGGTALYLIRRIILSKSLSGNKLSMLAPYAMVCLYPVAWYMISKNHSYEHAFMTYRELIITTFAGLCLLAEASLEQEKAAPGPTEQTPAEIIS